MIKRILIFFAVFGCAFLASGNRVVNLSNTGPTVVFQYSSAFSGTQGANGLRYGYYTSPTTPGTYSEVGMTWNGTDTWNGPETFSTPILTAAYFHPGISSVTAAVGRWTSTATGSASFKLDAQLATSAGDIKALVYINGTLAGVEIDISGDTSPHTTTVPGISISAGDTIDLVLNPNGTSSNDGTFIGLTITI